MKKKMIACLLTLSLVASALVGCGGKTEPSSAQGEKESETAKETETKTEEEGDSNAGEEAETASKYQTTYGSKTFDNVTITVELFDRSNAPEGSTITENKWTDYVKQEMGKVGINVEFVPVPRWDEVTKMQAMVASQTAPDLTLTYTYAYAEDYFNQGGTWDPLLPL